MSTLAEKAAAEFGSAWHAEAHLGALKRELESLGRRKGTLDGATGAETVLAELANSEKFVKSEIARVEKLAPALAKAEKEATEDEGSDKPEADDGSDQTEG